LGSFFFVRKTKGGFRKTEEAFHKTAKFEKMISLIFALNHKTIPQTLKNKKT
jgi:hypothetical protein